MRKNRLKHRATNCEECSKYSSPYCEIKYVYKCRCVIDLNINVLILYILYYNLKDIRGPKLKA